VDGDGGSRRRRGGGHDRANDSISGGRDGHGGEERRGTEPI
jgi:hypothetical protein